MDQVDRVLLIFIEVQLGRTTGDVLDAFSEAVRHQPEALECHMMARNFNYLITARAADTDACRVFLGDILVRMPGGCETRVYGD